MIRIEDLTFTYPGAPRPTLNHVSLEVEDGDFLAVIGNNGCGKSTLCKTLNGLIPHFISGDMTGRVLIDGEDTAAMDVGSLAKKVGYVYQDFENQIVRPTVLDDASFACMNYAMADYEERGGRALDACGLSQKKHDYIWQLSGGQKHLLALAGMLALSPKILILDEPIAQLDPGHAREIYEVLKNLNENHGITVIVIEHHTEFIASYCKHAVLMKNGEILWKLPAKEALRRVDELEESNIFPPQITVAAKRLKEAGVLSPETKLPTTVAEGEQVFGKLLLRGDYRAAVRPSVRGTKKNVEFSGITVKYRAVKGDSYPIFNDFSLDIHKGEKIALIGSNGAGKTTLMKLMMGLIRPEAGDVRLDGRETADIAPEELSNRISLVYQNPEEMFIKDTIRGDIEFAMKMRKVKDYRQRTDELLGMFHLEELADRDGRLLSGGQMRRASLAVGIALNPSILLLDEPTANLDIATRKEIIKTLNVLKDVTETVMIATHDMQLVCDWAERIIVLSAGRVIADGDRDAIFSDSHVLNQVGIRPPEIFYMGSRLLSQARCYTIEEFTDLFERKGAS